MSLQKFLKKSNLPIHFCFVVLIIFFATTQFILYSNIITLYETQQEIEKHDERLDLLSRYSQHLVTAESSQRSYLITGNKNGLRAFEEAREEIPKLQEEIKLLYEKDLVQTRTFNKVITLTNIRFDEMLSRISLFDTNGFDTVSQLLTAGNIRFTQQIKALVDRMVLAERDALRSEYKKLVQKQENSRNALVVGASGNTIALFSLYFLLIRFWRAQRRFQEETEFESEVALSEGESETLESRTKKVVMLMQKRVPFELASVYLMDKDHFRLAYSVGSNENIPLTISPKSCIAYEHCSRNEILSLNNLPQETRNQLTTEIESVYIKAKAMHVVFIPLFLDRVFFGFIEIGSLTKPFTDEDLRFFTACKHSLSVSISSIMSRDKLRALLSDSQEKGQQLEIQKEELKSVNYELEKHTEALQRTQTNLQVQQEELRQSNEELEQQASALEEQRQLLRSRNAELLEIKKSLEKKSSELERANRYKSEFLANMSHELRTPLNSILILADILAQDRNQHFSPQEREYASTIKNSGQDLLELIDDILDLSKVEAGKLSFTREPTPTQSIVNDIEKLFLPMAKQKKISFTHEIAADIPEVIMVDALRIKQVLKNLVSNAIKFTKAGHVSLSIRNASQDQDGHFIETPEDYICFAVEDTGMGISEKNMSRIFNAFEQGDGSHSREHSGTGLGLTISLKLAQHMHGKIKVTSIPDKGSTFFFYLPKKELESDDEPQASSEVQRVGASAALPIEMSATESDAPDISEISYENHENSEKSLLIIEDDFYFADLVSQEAQAKGFTPTHVNTITEAVEYLKQQKPAAILLDIRLPDGNGLLFLERLMKNPHTSDIPTHVISSFDYQRHALRLGAIGYVRKPADQKSLESMFSRISSFIEHENQSLLVIEDDEAQRLAIAKLFEGKHLTLHFAKDGKEAFTIIEQNAINCIILDLTLPDMNGLEFLEHLAKKNDLNRPPVVVYTGQTLSSEDEAKLAKYTDSVVIKTSKSPERLLSEVNIFLHRLSSKHPEKSEAPTTSFTSSNDFQGKRILLVDDDSRNIFALSAVLEQIGFEVTFARDGHEALKTVSTQGPFDVVLMDIMMPQMDGHEATRRIRSMGGTYKDLPIVALTAKAMLGDKEKCLESGANDYLAKPVNIDKLISTLNIWVNN